MALQPLIRRGTRSNATARRLVVTSRTMAPHVERATVARDDIKQPVMRSLMLSTSFIAGVRILAGQHFYLVASPKFAGRFYVMVKNIRGWQCSSPEEAVRAYCLQKVESYRAQLVQKQAA